MIVIGARGHAIEILQIFHQKNKLEELYFFDNVNSDVPPKLFDKYPILTTFEQVELIFKQDNHFVLGLGMPMYRKMLSQKLQEIGGHLCSIISPFAKIGSYGIHMESGLNVMTDVVIYNNVTIGEGTLLNTACSIHHDCKIGDYCEISPGARILGNVIIGNQCSIGTNACILPKLKIGNNVTIGAGAVVTKDLPNNCSVVGVPAKPYNILG